MSAAELVELIGKLPADKQEEVKGFVDDLLAKVNSDAVKPGFGSMKGLVTYISDDFDEPLEDFKDYM